MITADEARRKTIINTRAKELMALCEQKVLDAIGEGEYSTNVTHHYSNTSQRAIVDAVITELNSLGYNTKATWVKRIPGDPYNGCEPDVININWERQE